MKKLLSTLLFGFLVGCGSPSSEAAPSLALTVPSNPIAINITVTRTTGISPLTVWYDATTTTDSATTTPFIELDCTWDFGDTGASGTGTWSTGNPAFNSMNAGRGLITAHTYVVPDGNGDTTFTASVSCKDKAGNTKSANASTVTVYDASGSNGFPTTATTCVYNTTLGSGCPTGAQTLQTSSLSTAFGASYFGSNKRLLFKCGDSFSGGYIRPGSAIKFSVGAYGTCVGTKSGRPTFVADGTGTFPDNGIIFLGSNASTNHVDGRFADIECNGNGDDHNGCITQPYANGHAVSQITMYNLSCVGCYNDFAWNAGNQMALVWSSKDDSQGIGTYLNSKSDGYKGVSAWSTTYCPSADPMSCLSYQALIGNDLAAPSIVGVGGSGIETVRMSVGQYVVIANNWIRDSSTNGPMLKMHCMDGDQNAAWLDDLTSCKYVQISDNHIGKHLTTTDGCCLVDFGPQDGGSDERWQYVVFENNFLDNATPGTRSMTFSGQDMVARNNIFWMNGNDLAMQIITKGSNQTSTFPTTNVYAYNNTIYDPAMSDSAGSGIYVGACHGATGGTCQHAQDPTGVTVKNTLCYTTLGYKCVEDESGTNTVSNNTVTMSNNPSFVNGSGNLSLGADFQPTANYSGADSTVPVLWDFNYDVRVNALGAVNP